MMTQRPFHREIDELVGRVQEMAKLSRQALRNGVQAFADLQPAAARTVIQRDGEINRLDVEIESRALDLIARHQPMAIDLRTLGACLKIITYLDRIGRYGYDIAQATLQMEGKEHVRKLVAIPHMAELTDSILADTFQAFSERNEAKVRALFPRDEVIDALNDQIFRECVTYMLEDPKNISPCAHYILIARHLERAADNAMKIAEKTLYMITGERRLKL